MNQVMLIMARWEGLISLRGTMEKSSSEKCIVQIPPPLRKPLLGFWPTVRDTAFLYHVDTGKPHFIATTSISEFDPAGAWIMLAAPFDLPQASPRVRVSFKLELSQQGSVLWRRARALDLSAEEMTLVDRACDSLGTLYSLRLPLPDGELALEGQLISRQGALKTIEFITDLPWQRERLLANVARMMLPSPESTLMRAPFEPFLDEIDRIERILKLIAHHPALERVLCPPIREIR